MRALGAALSSREPVVAVALFIDRFSVINSRYGAETSDDVLLMISQSIAQRLKPNDELFRWNGCSFLVLLKREVELEATRAEIARWNLQRLEFTVVMGERTILLPVSISWITLPVWQSLDAESLAGRIDAFVLKSGGAGG